jgi:outer membrane lipoprotein SlyB
MMSRRFSILWVVLIALPLCGCGNGLGGRSYSRSDARQAYKVSYGEVFDVHPVAIEGEYTQLGTLGGGLVGYSVGRSGSGGRVTGAIGGVAGAVVGRETEKAATSLDGLEITIDMDRGDTLVIVQANDVSFSPGEKVRVLRGRGNEARVVKRQ